ncbi:hypothetical protein [Amycolatopsis sp. CA-230715]|uniref:hypothetical protein n=1 Tax=Amycolatopsis sp. CA-230715 TaxID=2745196 RepID=UPI001C019DE4|nr:hypothetical protein [Amycolatopsis sp. CA-230715]QWF82804.1 hypothetical protein HUW46_06243 [Amycolatopsis sp. CA-230715]
MSSLLAEKTINADAGSLAELVHGYQHYTTDNELSLAAKDGYQELVGTTVVTVTVSLTTAIFHCGK